MFIKDLSLSSDNDPVYMLVTGTCKVALQLNIVENHHSKRLELTDVTTTSSKHTKTQWVIIHHLEPREMFGIGELKVNPGLV